MKICEFWIISTAHEEHAIDNWLIDIKDTTNQRKICQVISGGLLKKASRICFFTMQ